MMQGASVGGVRLPSGLVVPEGAWRLRGEFVVPVLDGEELQAATEQVRLTHSLDLSRCDEAISR